jgi:uncharacterized membrane protein YbhN (UPF0104 family)
VFRKMVAFAVLGGFAGWAVWYLLNNRTALESLRGVSASHIVALGFLSVLVFFWKGLIDRTLLLGLGIRLRPSEWFGLSVVATMLNYLMPFRGGAAARAAYLKARKALPISSFASMLAATLAFQGLSRFLLALGCLSFLLATGSKSNWGFLAVCALGAIVTMAVMFLTPRFSRPSNRHLRFLWRVGDGWRTIHDNRGLVCQCFAINVATAFTATAAYMVALHALGVAPGFARVMTMSVLGEIGGSVGVTPGGFGVYEASASLSARLLGANVAVALVAVLMYRAVALVVALLLGPAFVFVLHRSPVSA